MRIIGDQLGIAEKCGGADDGVGKFQTVATTQFKSLLQQAFVFYAKRFNVYSFAKGVEAVAVTFRKVIESKEFQESNDRNSHIFGLFKLSRKVLIACQQ